MAPSTLRHNVIYDTSDHVNANDLIMSAVAGDLSTANTDEYSIRIYQCHVTRVSSS